MNRKLVALLVCGLVLANCASNPERVRVPRLADDLRASVRDIGVITNGPLIGGTLDAPVGVGENIAIGVAQGGTLGALAGAGTGALIGLACGPLFFGCVPAGAVIGGVFGLAFGGAAGGYIRGSSAIPNGIAADLSLALSRAMADHEMQADLRTRVLQQIRIVTSATDLGSGGSEWAERPDYSVLGVSGVDPVLEISLVQVGFISEGGDDPALQLLVIGRARLVEVATKKVPWDAEQVVYESPMASSSFWLGGELDLLRAEIENGLEGVAQQIGGALVGVGER